eukprot:maker-scaffold15_size728074-snap-gene-0.12 protein:Tk08836 transcript:maker-scaffold15_size728074-snap-gene-0.12-mRNA-1 annotation:"kyphoscoliosis "
MSKGADLEGIIELLDLLIADIDGDGHQEGSNIDELPEYTGLRRIGRGVRDACPSIVAMTNSRGRMGGTAKARGRDEDIQLSASAIERAAQYAKDAGEEAVSSLSKFSGLALHQRNFLKQVATKRYSPDEQNWDEAHGIQFNAISDNVKDPEIIDLHERLAPSHTRNRALTSTKSQTDPVQDEAFDWDLSDKTEVETQTMPSSRVNSGCGHESSLDTFYRQDAIVQTDQRLAFLLKRSTKNQQDATPSQRIRLHDAWCQTHIEVQEIGVQVTPSEFDSGDEDSSSSGYSEGCELAKPRVRKRDLTYAEIHAETVAKRISVRPKVRRGDSLRGMLDSNEPSLPSVDSSFKSQSDAGFQVNLSRDAGIPVAKQSNRGEISSPVGESLLRSLHFHESLDVSSPMALKARGRVKNKNVIKVDVAVQTENDIITDVSSTFKAVPSPLRKYELIGEDPEVFTNIDAWVVEISRRWYKSLKTVVKKLDAHISANPKYRGIEELIKTRAFFRWVIENITYDEDYLHKDMTTIEILRDKRGVCRQFVKLFGEMCELADIRVKCLKGFAKGPDYHPGYVFTPGTAEEHAWNAVFVQGTWRLLDCTWGAMGTTLDLEGNPSVEVNEHYFLTDPDEFIFSHFPFDEAEKHFNRWQLLDSPVTLKTFNIMPQLMPMFFEYSLRLGNSADSKILQTDNTIEINIWAWEVVRFKYKFFRATEHESDHLNNYVFCCRKGRQRKNGAFKVTPPEDGTYYLKVYAKPEEEIQDEGDTLDHVATFLIHGVQISSPPIPWPLSHLPWGITEDFLDTGAILMNQSEPVIEMVGEKRQSITLKTPKGAILTLGHIYDGEGNELVQDKDRDVKYTVLLNRRKPLPLAATEDEESSLLPYLAIRTTEKETVFTIEPPPKPGYYKIQIFACRKPKKRGKIHIPLVLTFLLDYKHSKTSNKELSYHGSTRNSIAVSRIYSGVSRSTARGTSMTGLPTSPRFPGPSLVEGRSESKRSLESSIRDNQSNHLTPVD